MDLIHLESAEIDPPSRGLIQRYLGLEPPCTFQTPDLVEAFDSEAMAYKFAHEAPGKHLAVRLERGRFVAVNPSIAVRAWSLPDYWARVLVLHDALEFLEVDHAFACLTAGQTTELVPERPFLVTREGHGPDLSSIDRFVYDFEETDPREVDCMGETFEIPQLGAAETALVLAATGLPRQREAAQTLVHRNPPPDKLVPAFNYHGLEPDPEILEAKAPQLDLPEFVQEQRDRLGDQLLREGTA